MSSHFHVFDDAEALAQAAAHYIRDSIELSLRLAKPCRIALPGGTTPARCLQLLAAESLPWNDIEWYLSDERCLPVGHAERNDTLVRINLFANQTAPEHFFTISAELGAEAAADAYEKRLAAFHCLDIAVLGIGEDGHTASLFPDNPSTTVNDRFVVPVHHAPKPPPDRVSLSMPTLRRARVRIMLASGSGKADAIQRCRNNEDLPAARIGDCEWFIDNAANGTT